MKHYRKISKFIFLFVLISLWTSCASIGNNYQIIKIKTKPDDAIILVDNERVGKTPANIVLQKKNTNIIKLQKEGYETENVKLYKKVNFTFGIFGNLLCFFILYSPIGMGIDWYTGALYDYIPDDIHIRLVPEQKIVSVLTDSNHNIPNNNSSHITRTEEPASLIKERMINNSLHNKQQLNQRKRGSSINEANPIEDNSTNIIGNYYALVVGINKYKHWSKLKSAVNDANKISGVLKKHFGFKVKMILNSEAVRDKILEEINKYHNLLRPNDKFLLYYAGHGVFDQVTQKGYWIPYDAEKDNDTKWILADSITTNLKRLLVSDILVISDSCFSGTLTRSDLPVLPTTEMRNKYIKKMLQKQSRIIISSGGNEPVLDDDGSGNSIFANALIDGLHSINANMFTAQELFAIKIREHVAGNSNQTPEYRILHNSGHTGGDFVFIRDN